MEIVDTSNMNNGLFASIYYGVLGTFSLLLKPFLVLFLIILLAFLILLIGKFLKKAFGMTSIILVGVFIMILVIPTINATPINLSVTKDSQVEKYNPNLNYGMTTTLEIRDNVGLSKRLYLFFENTLPLNSSISSGMLCLYLSTIGSTNYSNVYYVYNDWKNGSGTNFLNETEITWNNQPCGTNFDNSTNCNLTLLATNITASIGFTCFEVTSAVNVSVRNHSFVVKTNETSSFTNTIFNSKQFGIESQKPYLFLNYCNPSWIVNYTLCNTSDSRTKYYYDSNNCGINTSLPVDNGTILSCDYCLPLWNCIQYDDVCPSISKWLNCLQVNDTKIPSCCSQTNLTSDCYANVSLFDKPCGNLTRYLNVPTYPYVSANTTYPMEYITFVDGVRTYINPMEITIWNGIINETFNMTFDNSSQSYKISFVFTAEGDYPFTIYSTYPYNYNLGGELLVRIPYNITFCAYEIKDQTITGRYENDFAYLIAEFTNEKRYYYPTLEQFITPLGFKTTYQTPVFHTLYRDGCGTFTLYEKPADYGVRLFDGQATFQTTFSPPNISKTYGANIFFGKYTFNQSDSYNVYLSSKDIHQYTWLMNWTYIILLILCVVGSVFLFFMFPDKPAISMALGLGFTSMLTLIRIGIYLFKGW